MLNFVLVCDFMMLLYKDEGALSHFLTFVVSFDVILWSVLLINVLEIEFLFFVCHIYSQVS